MLVNKALWQIETRINTAFDLKDLATSCSVSPYHLSRCFRAATGFSPMSYLRARRLSEAALRLAAQNGDILGIALDAQYGSHEAFTRAFAARFGVLPSDYRADPDKFTLYLQKALPMSTAEFIDLDKPEIKSCPALNIIGVGAACTVETTEIIPPLWQAFNARAGEVPSVEGFVAYGLCYDADGDGTFKYLAGHNAPAASEIPHDMQRAMVPEGRYAVFVHNRHISEIGKTVFTIWNKALGEQGLKVRSAPDFERYDARFDPVTGEGPVEIWIPIEP